MARAVVSDGASLRRYAKFMGKCNQAKVDVDQCFKIEKEVKRKKNLAKAREFDAFWQEQKRLGPGFTIPDVRDQNKEPK